MATYSIAEAEAGLKDLVSRVHKGEEIIVADPGAPSVKLVPVDPVEVPPKSRLRPPPGFAKGWDISAILKALDEPLGEEEQRAFGMID